MTENEAIEALKLEGGLEITGRPIRVAKFFEGIDVAIKALEEVQRYRELGTPEELQTMKESSFTAFELTLIVAGQMLLKEYRAIGTVEECKEAVEKLKEMRGGEHAE